jgi:hypothetical protein
VVRQVAVYLERTKVGARNWASIKRAATEWARSRRIEVVFVKRCPSSYDCVKVHQGHSSRRMAGWATLNYDPKTNIAWYGSLHLNTCYLSSAAVRARPPATSSVTSSASSTPDRQDLHARRLRLAQPAPDLRQGLLVLRR